MKKTGFILLCIIPVIMFLACAELFTTSLAGKTPRDLSAKMEKFSATEIVGMLSNPQQPISSGEAKAALDALAKKTPDELKSLNPDEKSAVLNAAGSAIISDPGKIINGLDFGNMDAETGKEIFNKVVTSVDSSVNTGAVSVLLSDPKTVSEASPDAVLIATASVIGSLASGSDKSFEEIQTGLSNVNWNGGTKPTPDDIASALAETLAGPGTEPTSDMKAVAVALAMMNGATVNGQTMNTADLPFQLPF